MFMYLSILDFKVCIGICLECDHYENALDVLQELIEF